MKNIKKFSTKAIVTVLICVIMLLSSLAVLLTGMKNAFARTDESAEMAYNYDLQNLKEYITDSETVHREDSFEVYGNCSVSESQFRKIVDEGSPKIYLHYKTNSDIALTYDALLTIKTPTQVYSHELSESEHESEEAAVNAIKSFIDMYSKAFKQNSFYLLE